MKNRISKQNKIHFKAEGRYFRLALTKLKKKFFADTTLRNITKILKIILCLFHAISFQNCEIWNMDSCLAYKNF